MNQLSFSKMIWNRTQSRDELICVLEETRRWLLRPDNDFSWSFWEDAEQATSEIEGLIEGVKNGVAPGEIYFMATGPLQEVSLSSGWAGEFLVLAEQFDRALKKAF